jgi:radical SAM protein with 4Fe4S-binding SPASM domain
MNGKYRFPAIYFEATRRCNLSCQMCMTGCNDKEFVERKLRDELTRDEIVERVFKPGLELGVENIAFSGGEFFLRPDAMELLTVAADLGFRPSVTTNATLINDDLLREMKKTSAGRVVLVFGINSIGDRSLNRDTRDAELELTLKAMEMCKQHGIGRHVVVNVGKHNMRDLDETLAWLKRNRIPFNRSPFAARNSGRPCFKAMAFDKADMEQYINPALRRHFNGYVSFTPFFLSPELHREVSGGDAWNVTVPQNPSIGCWVGTWLAINAEGDVSPCAILLDELTAGNVRDKTLYDVVDQSELFRRILDRERLGGKCGRCRYKRTCGGCRALAHFHTGDYMAEDPTCFFEPKDETTVCAHEQETNENFKRYVRLAAKGGMYRSPAKKPVETAEPPPVPAFEPAALEPAALEPAALEPAALEPAALEPVAARTDALTETLDVLTRRYVESASPRRIEAPLGAKRIAFPARSVPLPMSPPRLSMAEAFRALRQIIESGPEEWEIVTADRRRFYFRVASTPELRRRAFRLGWEGYRKRGYVDDRKELLYSAFDARPDTLIMLISDAQDRDVGTGTLVFDSPEDGLPVDEIFRDTTDRLRAEGRRMADLIRLVVDDTLRGCPEILTHLFNFGYIYAKHVMQSDDFVVAVNPRHVNYYRRVLGFTLLAEERTYPTFQRMPAVLLRLPLAEVTEEIRKNGGYPLRRSAVRSKYVQTYALEAEPFFASFLKHRHRPMGREEIERLGLAAPALAPHWEKCN